MTKMRNTHLIGLMIGVAAIALATPASAQTRQDRLSAGQRAAIHDCSVRASKYKDHSDENEHMFTFRTCMFERGVPGD
jgi:hypothetical protein